MVSFIVKWSGSSIEFMFNFALQIKSRNKQYVFLMQNGLSAVCII